MAQNLISNLTGAAGTQYDLVVVGSGFAGSMTTLNFLEECKKLGKTGKVALIEAGKEGERCGASRWTMAYLRLDKDNNFDTDWKHEMKLVSEGLADMDYCKKMEDEVPITIQVSPTAKKGRVTKSLRCHGNRKPTLLINISFPGTCTYIEY